MERNRCGTIPASSLNQRLVSTIVIYVNVFAALGQHERGSTPLIVRVLSNLLGGSRLFCSSAPSLFPSRRYLHSLHSLHSLISLTHRYGYYAITIVWIDYILDPNTDLPPPPS